MMEYSTYDCWYCSGCKKVHSAGLWYKKGNQYLCAGEFSKLKKNKTAGWIQAYSPNIPQPRIRIVSGGLPS